MGILRTTFAFFKSIVNLFINIILKILTYPIKKDRNLVLIGGWCGDRFADNSRYLFIESLRQKQYKVYFVVNNDDIYNQIASNKYVIKKWSFKSLYLHLKAKYHIIDQNRYSLFGYLSINAIRVNLWHGLPLKKIWKLQYKTENYNAISKFINTMNISFRELFKGYCSPGRWEVYYLVCPSKYDWDELFSKCVFSNLTKPIFCKYPRTEYLLEYKSMDNILLNNEKKYLDVINNLKKKNRKIFFYLPTFRDNNCTIMLGIKNDYEIVKYLDLLNNNNCILLTKLHSADKSIFKEYDNYINLDKDCDVNVFLPYVDCLITDYSSVYFDYLLYDRPILFHPYDYKYYANNDRGLLLDYQEYTPGFKSYNFEELYNNTLMIINNNFIDNFASERKKIKNKLIDLSFPNLFDVIGEIKK